LVPHGPRVAQHGRKTIVLLVRQRDLPQAQPARAVRPPTVHLLPNPHGRSRSARIGQNEMRVQNEVPGQNAKPGRPTSAPLRHAAKFLHVKHGFSMGTLAQFGRPIFTLKRLPAQNVRVRPVRAHPVPARLAPVTAGPPPAVQARPDPVLIGLGPAVPVSISQLLRTVPPQPGPSAAKEVWLVHLRPAAANLERAARVQAVNHSGLGPARAPGQTPVPATAPSGHLEQSPPAVLPVRLGPTLRERKAHPLTAPPAQSPIPAQPPALRERPAPDGSPSPGSPQTGLSLWGGSPASVAQASLRSARARNPSLEAPPNPATGLNPAEANAPDHVPAANRAERNADKNSPTAFHSGASSCSP
jgi:hypothetical protein